MHLLSAFSEKQAEHSISVAWIGHELGHGGQAAFWGEVKQKPRPASQPAEYQDVAGWFHLVSQLRPQDAVVRRILSLYINRLSGLTEAVRAPGGPSDSRLPSV